MGNRNALSFAASLLGGAAFTAWVIFGAEGAGGFRPFLNLEALLFVLGGTGACLAAAYPPGDVWRAVRAGFGLTMAGDERPRAADILRYGADTAMGMGAAATLLGLVLLLGSVEDVASVPRRMALSLVAMFYGVILSEAFFMPLSRRAADAAPGSELVLVDRGWRRMLVAFLAVGGGLLHFFVVMYALGAALNAPLRH